MSVKCTCDFCGFDIKEKEREESLLMIQIEGIVRGGDILRRDFHKKCREEWAKGVLEYAKWSKYYRKDHAYLLKRREELK